MNISSPSSICSAFSDVHQLLTNDSGGFIQAVLDCIPMPVFYKSIDGVYLGCNQAFSDIIGLSKEQMFGKTVHELFDKKQADVYFEQDNQLFGNPGKQVYESEVVNKDGVLRYVRFHKSTFNNSKGEVAGLIGVFEDLTEQKKLEKNLVKMASQDPLTGVNNRRTIESILTQEIKQAEQHDYPLALLMIDLDDFKVLNDTYGHIVGDQVLKNLVDLISMQLKESNYLGRFGGDEFIIILPNTRLDEAHLTAQKLLLAISEHGFNAQGTIIHLNVSIGVAAREDSDHVEQFISKADQAMYKAKQQGRHQVICY